MITSNELAEWFEIKLATACTGDPEICGCPDTIEIEDKIKELQELWVNEAFNE